MAILKPGTSQETKSPSRFSEIKWKPLRIPSVKTSKRQEKVENEAFRAI
jgi:hypothetical protein